MAHSEQAAEKLEPGDDRSQGLAHRLGLPLRVVRLVWGLIEDPRVPLRSKLYLAAAVGYSLLTGQVFDLLLGIDDALIYLRVARRLLADCDRAVALEHWTGTPEELDRLRAALQRWDEGVRDMVAGRDAKAAGGHGVEQGG
jgi:hypothetical protein